MSSKVIKGLKLRNATWQAHRVRKEVVKCAKSYKTSKRAVSAPPTLTTPKIPNDDVSHTTPLIILIQVSFLHTIHRRSSPTRCTTT